MLNVDGTQLLQAAQGPRGCAGIGQVGALTQATGAAGSCQAAGAGEGGAVGWVALERPLQAVLFVQVLVHKFVVLQMIHGTEQRFSLHK